MFSGTKVTSEGEPKMHKERLRQLRFKTTKVALFCGMMSIVASFNASAILACTSETLCGISGTNSFGSGNSDSLSYNVSPGPNGFLYGLTFSGTTGSLTSLEIPLFNSTDASSFIGPSGWSSTILTPGQPGWNWSYVDGRECGQCARSRPALMIGLMQAFPAQAIPITTVDLGVVGSDCVRR